MPVLIKSRFIFVFKSIITFMFIVICITIMVFAFICSLVPDSTYLHRSANSNYSEVTLMRTGAFYDKRGSTANAALPFLENTEVSSKE